MPIPAMRRLIEAGLAIGAFCLCFGIVANARAHDFETVTADVAIHSLHGAAGK